MKTVKDKCASSDCTNSCAIKRNGNRRRFCWKCLSRRFKAKHPYTYALNALRNSARRRSLPFTLTLAQFKEFCARTGYMEHRGTDPDSLTIDRIDWNVGYQADNIRVITHAENSRQGAANQPRNTRMADNIDVWKYFAPENEDGNEPF